MAEPQHLHDDFGDLIVIKADPLATGLPGGEGISPPAVIIGFYDTPFTGTDGMVRMRLSGERLAAFTEAIDRHAAHLAALASGSDDVPAH